MRKRIAEWVGELIGDASRSGAGLGDHPDIEEKTQELLALFDQEPVGWIRHGPKAGAFDFGGKSLSFIHNPEALKRLQALPEGKHSIYLSPVSAKGDDGEDYRWLGLLEAGALEIGMTSMGQVGVWRQGEEKPIGLGNTVIEALDSIPLGTIERGSDDE